MPIECSGSLAFIREYSGSLLCSGGNISTEGDVLFRGWRTLLFIHEDNAARAQPTTTHGPLSSIETKRWSD